MLRTKKANRWIKQYQKTVHDTAELKNDCYDMNRIIKTYMNVISARVNKQQLELTKLKTFERMNKHILKDKK